MTKFLPELLNIMTESQLKSIHVKLKQEYSLYAPSKNFSTYLATYPAAMEITCTYILHLLEKKEFRTITTLLPSVAAACQSGEGVSFPEGFLHMLVTWICSKIDTISENVLYAILKQLFVACCGHSESVLLYLCHLLWVVHHKIKPTILNEILEEMDPGDTVTMDVLECACMHVCIPGGMSFFQYTYCDEVHVTSHILISWPTMHAYFKQK